MTTTLSNGVKVPDVGSNNWGSDLETNWQLLNACIGAVGSNVQTGRANTWTARQTFTLPIYGDVVGTATMASSDASGNDIPTTYATKTELAAKAADSEVVHKAGAETITGDKTHAGILAMTGNNLFAWDRPQVTRGTLPSSTVYYGTTRYRDANLNSFLLYRGSINAAGAMDYGLMMYPWVSGSTKGWSFYSSADGNDVWLRPIGDNVHLGTASHKWLSFNGINPGALGMIDASSYVDIDTTSWTAGATTNRVYINGANPTYPGWLFIRMSNAASTDGVMIRLGSTAGAASVAGSMFDGNIYAVCPCPPNHVITVYFTGTITYCRYHACLGNV